MDTIKMFDEQIEIIEQKIKKVQSEIANLNKEYRTVDTSDFAVLNDGKMPSSEYGTELDKKFAIINMLVRDKNLLETQKKDYLKNYQYLTKDDENGINRVKIGDTVKLEILYMSDYFMDHGNFKLVAHGTATKQNKEYSIISVASPLGKAIFNQEIPSIVETEVPTGHAKIYINEQVKTKTR